MAVSREGVSPRRIPGQQVPLASDHLPSFAGFAVSGFQLTAAARAQGPGGFPIVQGAMPISQKILGLTIAQSQAF